MEVIAIEAKDITVIFQMTLTELEKMKLALDLAEIKYSGNKEEERDASYYLTNVVYPFILETIEKVKGKEK